MALKPELYALLIDGPSAADKRAGLVRFGGVATVRVLWSKHREQLMRECPPGRRPWAHWLYDRNMRFRPPGARLASSGRSET
jgi:hypothetical protein